MEDARIQRAVLAALEADERLSSHSVDVYVEEGQVRLGGSVPSFRQKLAAYEAAVNVAGAENVSDSVEVTGSETPSDEELAAVVRMLLARNSRLIQASVVVAVRAGRVTLSGSVRSDAERALAEDVVLQAAGVEHVLNQLVIDAAARSEALAVGGELEHVLANEPGLAGAALRVELSGDVAVLSGRAGSRAQVDLALSLVRRAWTGEVRDEVRIGG